MKNISVKKSFLYTLFIALTLVSCKKDIEKISDKIDDTVSSVTENSEEKDSSTIEKDSVVQKESLPPAVQEYGFYNAYIFPKDKKSQRLSVCFIQQKIYGERTLCNSGSK
ncbi:hypothetical protein [Chryseobacterium sp. POE27]|uniref:hypothetical protein n=1 Tax=Chryseobacterium sp. POE27 TaxID=3138177 RepID=UPI00321C3A5C